MGDPLSVAASVVALLTISVKITCSLHKFRDEVSGVDATLTGLINDVTSFQHVLESMKDTFDQDDVKSNLQATGHVGAHYKNLAISLEDSFASLQDLLTLLEGVNKTTNFLDGPRKQFRYKNAIDQIALFRERIQTFRAALQLSLSTIILWGQFSLQKSTDKIPERILPTLDKLYDEFRTLGASLNAKIEGLQQSVSTQDTQVGSELASMTNLRECVRAAADVVSTASSTLTIETSDKKSVKYGSDFGDLFTQNTNEPMMRWMSSNTVYEYDDMTPPLPDPSEASTGDVRTDYPSDSDSDIESDMIKALFNTAKKLISEGDLAGAQRKLSNCLTRLNVNASTYSLRSAARHAVSRSELLDTLLGVYCLSENWVKAKTTMMERLSITERQVGNKDELYLMSLLRLAEIMVKNHDYVEAHLQGRRSLRGFKRLGEAGQEGYEKSLVFLVSTCHIDNKTDEEEAYAALLANYRTINGPRVSSILDSKTPIVTSIPTPTRRSSPPIIMPRLSDSCDGLSAEYQSRKEREMGTDEHPSPTPAAETLIRSSTNRVDLTEIEHRPVLLSESRPSDAVDSEEASIASDSPVLSGALTRSANLNVKPGSSADTADDVFKPISDPTNTTESGKENPKQPQPMSNEAEETSTPDPQTTHVEDSAFIATKKLLAARNQPHTYSRPEDSAQALSDTTHSTQKSKLYELWLDHYHRAEQSSDGIRAKFYKTGPLHLGTRRIYTSSQFYPLITYSQQLYGRLPSLALMWQPEGWSCWILWEGVAGPCSNAQPSIQEAAEAAMTVTWEAMVTPSTKELLRYDNKLRDPYSDKEVVLVEERPAHTRYASDLPLIKVSTDDPHGNSPEAQTSVQRSRSDPGLPRNDVSDMVYSKDLSRHLSAISNNSQRAASYLDDLNSLGLDFDSTSTEPVENLGTIQDYEFACPICNRSLASFSETSKSMHVNGCIDSVTATIPRLPSDNEEQPRSITPQVRTCGYPERQILETWLCKKCMRPQVLSDQTCRACGGDRSDERGELEGVELQPAQSLPVTSTLSINNTDAIYRSVLLFGDACCGKTWLASKWNFGEPPEQHRDLNITQEFSKRVIIEPFEMELKVWDCSGLEYPVSFDRVMYLEAHVILICFDISNPDSFDNLSEGWIPDINAALPKLPKILVGCKKDLRNDAKTLIELCKIQQSPVPQHKGERLAKKMGALAYFETQTKTGEDTGIEELFHYVAKACLGTQPKRTRSSLRRMFGLT